MENKMRKQRLRGALGLVGLSAEGFIKKTGLKPHGGVKDGAPYYAKAAVERALGRIAKGDVGALYPAGLISGAAPIRGAVLLHLMAVCRKPIMKINGWAVIAKTDWEAIEADLEALASDPALKNAASQSGRLQTLSQYCTPWEGSSASGDELVVYLAGQNFVISPCLFVDACEVFPIDVGDYAGMGGEAAHACQSCQAVPAMMARFKPRSHAETQGHACGPDSKVYERNHSRAQKSSILSKIFNIGVK